MQKLNAVKWIKGLGAEARGKAFPLFIKISIPIWTIKMFTFTGLANGVVCILEVGRLVAPITRRSIMKSVKVMLFVMLAVLVSTSFAARKVKSKLGDIDVTAQKGGGAVVCTAHFNDELTILKDSDTEVLVKGSCGQGWVAKSKLEYVAQGPGDKTVTFDEFNIQAWIDNQSVFDVHIDNVEDFEGVTIDRDFREYLTYTIDREQTEMHNGEN